MVVRVATNNSGVRQSRPCKSVTRGRRIVASAFRVGSPFTHSKPWQGPYRPLSTAP